MVSNMKRNWQKKEGKAESIASIISGSNNGKVGIQTVNVFNHGHKYPTTNKRYSFFRKKPSKKNASTLSACLIKQALITSHEETLKTKIKEYCAYIQLCADGNVPSLKDFLKENLPGFPSNEFQTENKPYDLSNLDFTGMNFDKADLRGFILPKKLNGTSWKDTIIDYATDWTNTNLTGARELSVYLLMQGKNIDRILIARDDENNKKIRDDAINVHKTYILSKQNLIAPEVSPNGEKNTQSSLVNMMSKNSLI